MNTECAMQKPEYIVRTWHDGDSFRKYCVGVIDPNWDSYFSACEKCPYHVTKSEYDRVEFFRESI